MRALITIYLLFWAMISVGVIYWVIGLGYSLWLGLLIVYLLYTFVNGTLAYKAKSKQLKLEGKIPPSYFKYLFLPEGTLGLTEEAPTYLRIIVGIGAALFGLPFIYAGIVLFIGADFNSHPDPKFLILGLTLIAGIGILMLYVGIRLITHKNKSQNVSA